MNILFVHETEYIEKVVFEYQIIPEILSSRGHLVYVIDYPSTWKKKSFFDFGSFKTSISKDVSRAQKSKGITLIRPGVIKIPGLSRIVASLEYFFLIPASIKKYKIDLIVLYSVPTNGFQTIYWARKLGIPIHFRLLDVLHQLVPSQLLRPLTYQLEKYVYPRVNEITAITPRLTQYAIAMGANPKQTTYLPSGSDSDLFFPEIKDPALLKKYKLKPSDTIILFAGTLYNFSGLDIVLDYFGSNKEKFPHLKFMIVGHGEQETLLRKIIKQYDLHKNVILSGFINYENLSKYINLSDITINPFQINKVTNIIFPGKIYQYLACKKPVVATRLEGVLDIFPDNNGRNDIYYFDISKPEEFFDTIKKIDKKEVKDTNPSLQEITTILEQKFQKLLS